MIRKLLVSLIGMIILGLMVTACTQGEQSGEDDFVTDIPTDVIIDEAPSTPVPASDPTPLPTVISGQALQAYRTMLIIQANTELLREAAIETAASGGEGNLQDSELLRALTLSVVSADELFVQVQAPDGANLLWQRAIFAHQEIKEVLGSWMQGEADALLVVDALAPVILDIQRDVHEMEELLVAEYGFERAALERERQTLVEVMLEMMGGEDE